jgi:hypothetical protein
MIAPSGRRRQDGCTDLPANPVLFCGAVHGEFTYVNARSTWVLDAEPERA